MLAPFKGLFLQVSAQFSPVLFHMAQSSVLPSDPGPVL